MNYMNNWEAIRYSYVKDKQTEAGIYENGYATVAQLNQNTLVRLADLYHSSHSFAEKDGGMFYSVYSTDIGYRKKVHEGIFEILKPLYDTLFEDYKSIINSFIIKISGPKSEFYLHQDSTGLDESKYSALSVWIPLQDTDINNGCICVIPKSHGMFSPYRGISFQPPYEKIQSDMLKYLKPLEMKAGEVLVFDNRMVHNSLSNNSGKDRIAVMSGIFPVEAKIINCFKDTSSANSEIEIIEQDDNFLLDYPKFLNGCFDRPDTGRLVKKVKDIYSPVSAEKFEELCNVRGVMVNDVVGSLNGDDCKMIGEPVKAETVNEGEEKKTLISRLKEIFI